MTRSQKASDLHGESRVTPEDLDAVKRSRKAYRDGDVIPSKDVFRYLSSTPERMRKKIEDDFKELENEIVLKCNENIGQLTHIIAYLHAIRDRVSTQLEAAEKRSAEAARREEREECLKELRILETIIKRQITSLTNHN